MMLRRTFVVLLAVAVMVKLTDQKKHRTPAEITRWAGYPTEVHHVTTADGYILQLDRIPRPGRPAVYIANQMCGSAAAYMVLGKGKAFAFLLYEAGFDVWLGNFRGTPFSLHHLTLSSADDKFWEFGLHEHGALDNPAMMEFVLKHTAQSHLIFAGHSMGGSSFFVTASERPDLLARVRAAFLFAPAVWMANTEDKHIIALNTVANVSLRMADKLHMHQHPTALLEKVLDAICTTSPSAPYQELCARAGPGPKHHLRPGSDLFFSPGASIGELLHFAQLSGGKWPGFRKFNFGSVEANRAHYGSDYPPDYSLRHIHTPVYLYSGLADTMSTPLDLKTLKDILPNVQRFFFSPNKNFGHFDYVKSPTADEDMWNYVLADLKHYLVKKKSLFSLNPLSLISKFFNLF